MNIYIDGSGSFRIPATSADHACGIVVGIAIAEQDEPRVFERFTEFVSKLPGSALKNGEPKGNLLTEGTLDSFCDFVQQESAIIVNGSVPIPL
jgi:hypothetical protein